MEGAVTEWLRKLRDFDAHLADFVLDVLVARVLAQLAKIGVAGEPFEVALNGRLVARGEVVMVEKSSGVRIVDVLKSAVAP